MSKFIPACILAALTAISGTTFALDCNSITGNTVDVKLFSAVGDGSTDDSAAIQSALNCAITKANSSVSQSATLYFPSGRYVLAAPIVWDQVNSPGTDLRQLVIKGDGNYSSSLISENLWGVFFFLLSQRASEIHILDIGLVAGQAQSGHGVYISQPIGGNRHNRGLVVSDVNISNDSSDVNYFLYGVRAIGTWRPLLQNVVMTGPFGPGASDLYATEACFSFTDVYSPTVTHSRCWSAHIGLDALSAETQGPEGFMISNNKFVEVEIGITLQTVNQEPEGNIINNHINASYRGLSLNGKRFVFVNNNLFYSENADGTFYQDILVTNSEKISVSNNIFHYPGNSSRTMVRVAGNSRDVTIRDNLFNASGTAISLNNTVKYTKILDNRFFNVETFTGDPLTQTDIIDQGVQTEVRLLTIPEPNQ